MHAERRVTGRKRRRDDFDLQERLDALMELAIWIAGGIAGGLVLAIAIRACGARWSWALAGVPLVVVAWPISWPLALASVITVGVAAVCGFAWHKQDLERGGMEAEGARERRGPLTALRGARDRRRRRFERVHDGRLAGPDGPRRGADGSASARARARSYSVLRARARR